MHRKFILFLLIALAACSSEQVPEGIIEEDTYIDLLVEFQLVRSYSFTEGAFKVDSVKLKVLEAYNITPDQFVKTHAYYEAQTEEQMKRVDVALERVIQFEDELLPPEPDSVDQGSRHAN